MRVDDQRLIAATQAGDVAAFGDLVARYQDRLYNSLLRLVGNAEDARDVAQESFLQAFQALPSFKGEAQFFTWLYRIAVNTAITMKRKRRAVLSLQPDAEREALDPPDRSEHSRPESGLERSEEETRVHAALARLSAEHRTVLILKDMEGMKYEEMAEVLQVAVGTIRSRLHRARLELRAIFAQEEKQAGQRG